MDAIRNSRGNLYYNFRVWILPCQMDPLLWKRECRVKEMMQRNHKDWDSNANARVDMLQDVIHFKCYPSFWSFFWKFKLHIHIQNEIEMLFNYLTEVISCWYFRRLKNRRRNQILFYDCFALIQKTQYISCFH